MAMTDPLGDMLTRIRNGQRAKKDSVLSPASKLRANVLEVLQREGYIRGYSDDATGKHPALRIERPGRRFWTASKAGEGTDAWPGRTARLFLLVQQLCEVDKIFRKLLCTLRSKKPAPKNEKEVPKKQGNKPRLEAA